MLTVQIGERKEDFKNQFDELTVKQFADFIQLENQIEAELKKADELSGNIEQLLDAGAKEEAIFLEAELIEKNCLIRMERIRQLSLLSSDPPAVEQWLTTTKRIDFGTIRQIWQSLNEGFGSLEDFFKKLPAVKSFRFKDFKRHGIFRQKKTTFHVADLDRQTVIRDAAALVVSRQIGNIKDQFQKNDWRNFARFVAYVARPKKEHFEYMPKEGWRSFIGGKGFQRLSATDRLSAYNQKLSETVEERSKIFEDLPLIEAIGIYKYYFFLKKNFQKPSKAFIPKMQKRQKKRSFISSNLERKPASKT